MSAFRCPKCNSHTGVTDTRVAGKLRNSFIRRRRECAKGHRFTTYETVVHVKVYGHGDTMMRKNTHAQKRLTQISADFSAAMELLNAIAAKL